MIINAKNFYFMRFSATATHFGASKTTQLPHNQLTFHLQQLLTYSLFQLQLKSINNPSINKANNLQKITRTNKAIKPFLLLYKVAMSSQKVFTVFCFWLFGLASLVSNAQKKPSYTAFQKGETLNFRLTFNGIYGGESNFIVMKETQIIADKQHYHVHVTGTSSKLLDAFYKVRDFYDSYIDINTLLPTVFIRDVTEGRYTKKEHYVFDQKKNRVKVRDTVFKVNPNIHDLVSAFYYLRCFDYNNAKKGDFFPVEAFFEEESFPMGVWYVGKETIKTNIGKVRCKVFHPKLIEGRVFQEQSSMRLYVSDDKNQIPIRIESDVYLGTVKAEISTYKGLKYSFDALIKDK